MGITYLAGFTLFATGILTSFFLLLNAGAILLIITAALYNWNILKVVNHKPVLK